MRLHPNSTIRYFSLLKISTLIFLLLLILQTGIQSAKADTWTICQSGGCDFTSIQTAVNNTNVVDGDTLSFPTPRETYAAFTINNKALIFLGNDTEINANELSAAIIINGNKNNSFDDFSILNGNSNTDGGGIQLNGGDLTLTNVILNNNDASNQGGALYIGNGSSTVILNDVSISDNTAVSGGAIYNNGDLTAENLTLSDNIAANGGGLYNNGEADLGEQSTVQRNGDPTTQSGGGIFNTSSAELTISDSNLANNEADDGAGIYNEGTLQLTNSNIGSGNVAIQAGGGLYNSGQSTLSNSAVVQNYGDTGAGIYNVGTLIANNSTLSRNDGPNGAGLYNMGGSATLNNVTIHLTIGTSIFTNGGTVTVGNTIISSISGESACGGGGTAVSNGYNLASDESCTFLTATGDLTSVDPDLNGLTSPTDSAVYHSPKLTSPAVDAGNPATPGSNSTACLATDQNGLARPQSKQCDIGAVEIVVYRIYIPTVTK